VNMNSARLLTALLTLTSSPVSSWAQSTGAQGNYEYSGGAPKLDEPLSELRGAVGKEYWVRKPAAGHPPNTLFCESTRSPPFEQYPLSCPGKTFGVKETERFTIEDVLISKPIASFSWFKIRFESGKTAYLSYSDFKSNRYVEGKYSTSLHGADFVIRMSGWIFEDNPESVFDRLRAHDSRERDEKRRESDQREKERLARGGVRIGMTAQQVINSSWGKPESVNSTIIGAKTLEQWVYGNGHYLYFESGRLRTIQTSR